MAKTFNVNGTCYAEEHYMGLDGWGNSHVLPRKNPNAPKNTPNLPRNTNKLPLVLHFSAGLPFHQPAGKLNLHGGCRLLP